MQVTVVRVIIIVDVAAETEFLVEEMVQHAQLLHMGRVGRQALLQLHREHVEFHLRQADVE